MAERLKDMFFTEASINALADAIKLRYERFNKKRLLQLVLDDESESVRKSVAMLKAGDRRAMLLFGFGNPKHIGVDKLKLNKRSLAIGDQLQFSFALIVAAKKACKTRLEYIVYFARPSEKVGKKVFQITENTYEPGEHTFTRKHSFADLSTRKHHPGKHVIAIVVNGVEKARAALSLLRK